MSELTETYSNAKESAPIKFKKRMGFGLIAAALLFLFNPDINVIDVLPDIFGYILLSVGLSHLSLLNEYIADARNKFNKMIFVSAAKLASIVFIFGMSNAANRPYSFLLFSFTFAVVEMIFLIPAYNNLFKGILAISDRHGGSVAYSEKKKRKKCYAERIQILTLFFIVFKAVNSAWPEFISLVNTEYTDNFVMYMYDYIGAFRIIAFLPTLAVGIVWLVKSFRFYWQIGSESNFIENIKTVFVTDIFPKKGLFIKRALNAVLILLAVAAVFCVDFSLGSVGIVGDSAAEINVIPDAVSACLILVSMILLKNYVTEVKRTKKFAIIFLALSITSSLLKLIFIVKFDYYTAINKVDAATNMFNVMCIVTLLENVAFVLTIVFLTKTLKEIIKKYTGYASYSNAVNSERVTTLQRELTGKLKYMIIFAVLGAITAVMYEVLLPEKHTLAQYMWAIDFVAQALFAAFTLRCLFAIKDEIENRFMLE